MSVQSTSATTTDSSGSVSSASAAAAAGAASVSSANPLAGLTLSASVSYDATAAAAAAAAAAPVMTAAASPAARSAAASVSLVQSGSSDSSSTQSTQSTLSAAEAVAAVASSGDADLSGSVSNRRVVHFINTDGQPVGSAGVGGGGGAAARVAPRMTVAEYNLLRKTVTVPQLQEIQGYIVRPVVDAKGKKTFVKEPVDSTGMVDRNPDAVTTKNVKKIHADGTPIMYSGLSTTEYNKLGYDEQQYLVPGGKAEEPVLEPQECLSLYGELYYYIDKETGNVLSRRDLGKNELMKISFLDAFGVKDATNAETYMKGFLGAVNPARTGHNIEASFAHVGAFLTDVQELYTTAVRSNESFPVAAAKFVAGFLVSLVGRALVFGIRLALALAWIGLIAGAVVALIPVMPMIVGSIAGIGILYWILGLLCASLAAHVVTGIKLNESNEKVAALTEDVEYHSGRLEQNAPATVSRATIKARRALSRAATNVQRKVDEYHKGETLSLREQRQQAAAAAASAGAGGPAPYGFGPRSPAPYSGAGVGSSDVLASAAASSEHVTVPGSVADSKAS